MKLTTRGRFAVTSMIDLALYGGEHPIRLCDIASRQHISVPYLEHIFARLRRAELVVSVRGPGGGYLLARPKEEITAGEIVSALDGQVEETKCRGGASCLGGAECLAYGLWTDMNHHVAEFLYSRTLADILKLYAANHLPDSPDVICIKPV